MRIHSTSDDERAWLYTSSQRRHRRCSCSLSLQRVPSSSSTVQRPSSTTPVLLSCVDSSDTAPPPCYPACSAPLCLLSCVDFFDTGPPPSVLLAGYSYTPLLPPTGDGPLSCVPLSGPQLHAPELGPPLGGAWSRSPPQKLVVRPFL